MSKRVSVFIDASNLWAVQKVRGQYLDLKQLKEYLKIAHGATTMVLYYYDAYPETGTRDYDTSGKHAFYTYLKKGLGFIVRKKPLKQLHITTDQGVVVQEKGNMDVELVIDAVNKVEKYDEAILFSGDSDFLALVRFIRNRGKKVYVYSTRTNISKELLTGGDGYRDILNIKDNIWRGKIEHRNKTTLD
ncbi:MAG: NYN domain-containing protein [Candidatus Saccharimonadales bacterium]